MIKKQFTLYLENRPGVLAKITSTLASRKVNIEGISATTSADVGLVQIVADNAAATKKALTELKIPFTLQDVAVLPLKNKAGALAAVAAKLARSGVNISYLYGTSCTCSGDCGCACKVIISAPDLKAVEKVWNRMR